MAKTPKRPEKPRWSVRGELFSIGPQGRADAHLHAELLGTDTRNTVDLEKLYPTRKATRRAK